jgi:hypothetical protein
MSILIDPETRVMTQTVAAPAGDMGRLLKRLL